MTTHVTTSTGISAHKRSNDLSDFESELDMIEKLAVSSIELPTYDMDIVIGGKIRKPQLESLKRACRGRGVRYTVHGPLAINFMDEQFRLQRHFDVLCASLEVAAEVSAINYVMHTGVMRQQQAAGIEAAYQRQREWLAKAGERAKDAGVFLCVETLYPETTLQHTATPQRLASELAAINHSHVWATIDFSHSYIQADYHGARADYVAAIAALAPYAKHLHVHDSFGRQDDIWMYTDGEKLAFGHGDLHLPVGWGDIPWAELMQACTFADGVVFNIELESRYWYAAQETVDAVKVMAETARVVKLMQAAE